MSAFHLGAHDLRALQPSRISSYLRAAGWGFEEDYGEFASIWTANDDKDVELFVPTARSAADYHLRVAELLQSLATLEQRPLKAILSDIQAAADDIVRIRAASGSSQGGTLKLNDAVEFVRAGRDALLYAACSTARPSPVYHSRKPAEAVHYMDSIRQGQTEIGSFVLKMHSPVPPRVQESLGDAIPDEPFARCVTQNLMTALHELAQASALANNNSSFAPFEDAVPLGVSSNLCDAVADACELSAADCIDFAVSWAGHRPPPAEIATLSKTVRLSQDYVLVIREASRHLKRRFSAQDFELEGAVLELVRQDSTEAKGTVRILGEVPEGGQRKVRVEELESEHYQLLRDAHEQGLLVTVTGQLSKVSSRTWGMKKVRHVAVHPEE